MSQTTSTDVSVGGGVAGGTALAPAQIEAKPATARTTTTRISLCLLVWNELHGCTLDVPGLPKEQFDEVYAVDGGSKDGTGEYLKAQGIPVHVQQIRGYNGAMIEAFRRCTTDAVVLYHPKGSIDPQEVLLCRQKLLEGYDLAVGSRIMPGGRNEEDAHFLKPRKWFVMGIATLGAILWKRGRKCKGQPIVMDVLHGFRGMRKEAFFAIDPIPQGLSMDLEMVVRSYKLGFKACEFPSKEKPRPAGDTHFKAWPTGKKLLKYMWHELGRKAAFMRQGQ
jgi:glycosyltransferase involved in cell wall biosynthesis